MTGNRRVGQRQRMTVRERNGEKRNIYGYISPSNIKLQSRPINYTVSA